MRRSLLFCLFLPFGFLVACSNQQMYEAVQANRIQDCNTRYAHESAREQCKEGYQTSYEDYEAERTTDTDN